MAQTKATKTNKTKSGVGFGNIKGYFENARALLDAYEREAETAHNSGADLMSFPAPKAKFLTTQGRPAMLAGAKVACAIDGITVALFGIRMTDNDTINNVIVEEFVRLYDRAMAVNLHRNGVDTEEGAEMKGSKGLFYADGALKPGKYICHVRAIEEDQTKFNTPPRWILSQNGPSRECLKIIDIANNTDLIDHNLKVKIEGYNTRLKGKTGKRDTIEIDEVKLIEGLITRGVLHIYLVDEAGNSVSLPASIWTERWIPEEGKVLILADRELTFETAE